MKFSNLILALQDQMPLRRLLRNLFKGHLLGLFSQRSHLNANGNPKVMYNTKKTAGDAAAAMMVKRGVYFSNYKCIFCDGYHIGRNRENKG